MIHFYKACMAGPYHIDENLVCQDSCHVVSRDDGVCVAACGDGLGSELYSHIGSQIGTKISVEYCAARYTTNMQTEDILHLIKEAFLEAYQAILEEASRAGNPDDEYDTTLCLVIYDGVNLWYGQSGDSGIVVLLKNGEYHPITTQQRDQDGYVFPLCSGPQYWEFGKVEHPVSSVMLMTDGMWDQICPPILKMKPVKINVALAQRFMDYSEITQDELTSLEAAAYSYLEKYPRRLLDDDKTVIVLFNSEAPALKLEAAYYHAPNWEELGKEAATNLYPKGNQNTMLMPISLPAKDNTASCSGEVPEASAEVSDGGSEDSGSPLSGEAKPPPKNQSNNHHKPAPERQDVGGRLHRFPPIGVPTLDLIAIALLLTVSLLAFFAKGFVEEHAPSSYLGILLVCFVANASVLLPAPSILIVIQFALLLNPLMVAFSAAMGAAMGEMVGFLAGGHCRRLMKQKVVAKLQRIIPRYPYIVVFLFSLLPLPFFDIVGIMAGAMRLNRTMFFASCFLGKFLKMLVFAWLASLVSLFLA